MQTLVGKFTQCSETFTWQWSSSKFSNFCSWVCRKNSTHSLCSKCIVWLPVQRMSRSLFSRSSFAFVVDSVHAFKLWFSVRKKRSLASPIGMVNLNCDWFFKLVKNSSLECACYCCHLAAWTSYSPGCRADHKVTLSLAHLRRSTEFLWISNAEFLKKSSMPVFSSQEIFYG